MRTRQSQSFCAQVASHHIASSQDRRDHRIKTRQPTHVSQQRSQLDLSLLQHNTTSITMSFFGGALSPHSQSHSHANSHPHNHNSKPQYHYTRPHTARSTSSYSFFSRPGSGGGSSSYRRRPRDGYIQYLLHKLKRLVQDLYTYARRHPVKAFFAVVVPLLSAGGAIGGILRQFGVRLPMGLEGLMGGGGLGAANRHYSGGYYGSRGYDGYARSEGVGVGDMMGGVGSVIKLAQAFM